MTGHRFPRRMALLLLGVAVLAALVWAGSASAGPSPAPGPAPSPPGSTAPPGVPDPGSRPPGAHPSPSASSSASAPTPIPQPTPQPGGDDPAWYDIPGQVRKAIRDFFADLVEDNINSVMATLGETVLSTPDLSADERVKTLWTTSLVTTNAVFVLFIVGGGFVVASRETLQTRYGLKQILPRLAVAAVVTNTSLLLCGKLLWATNSLTAAIAGQGVDAKSAGDAISQSVKGAQFGNNFLLVMLALAVIVTAFVVAITFVMRVACLVLLIGFAPLGLVCHALPQTEGLAYTWWRAMGACLGIQLAQAAIVLGAIRIFFTPTGSALLGLTANTDGYAKILICLCMLWILIKIPGWTKQFVLGPIGQRHGRGLIGQLIHTYLTIKTLGTASGLLKGAKAAPRRVRGLRPSPPRTHGPRPSLLTAASPSPLRAVSARPSPAGPAAFSHAPATHTPLPSPSGTPSAPTFSHPPRPTNPFPKPFGVAPVAQFSHPYPPETPFPSPSTPPPRVTFSAVASTTARPAPTAATPTVTFSAASPPQSAPRRPPAPVTPVFSTVPECRTATPANRPTAARRAPQVTPPSQRRPRRGD